MGGAEYSLAEFIGYLQEIGSVHPIVATAEGGVFQRHLETCGIETLSLPIPLEACHFPREQSNNPLALMHQWRLWQKPLAHLKRWLRHNPVQLIHSNTLKMHVLGSLLSRQTQIPILWHIRDILTHRGNASRVLKGASLVHSPEGILAISQAVEESLQGIQGKYFTRTVYNGLNITGLQSRSADKAEIRRILGLPPNDVLIVSVGYFIPWKGQDTLIRAFAKLHERYPHWRLCLIGKPIFQFQNEQERLEALGRSLGVDSHLHFLGERQDIVATLPAFDLFVCPSTMEPFGRVILEAMAARVPIVATMAGGIPGIVRQNQEALLVPPSDPEAMAEAMAKLLTHPELGERLAHNAYQRLTECFTLEQTARQVVEAYHQLLAARA